METNQKLAQFMDAVNRSTDAEIARAEQEAEQEAQELLKNAQAQCSAEAARELTEQKAAITAKYQKRLSQIGYRGKTSLLGRRQMLLMQLFDDLRRRLAEFTASPEYLPWLKKLLGIQPPEADAVILLREADMKYQEQLEQAVSVPCTFRIDRTIRMGGLSVLSADGRRCENHTLDEAYASKLRNFYRDHKIDGGEE
ncbi:MAG: hypothetical protein IKQ39_04015 [Oscillospiraceae bacterium]|nr:hypothetical protein [Oscillospiraceae bacterium]